MASTGKKWAVGCGIGCGFMLLLVVGVGSCSYIGVRKVVKQAEGIEESVDMLDEKFGHPRQYTPEADGTIAAERIEVFLAAREAMAPASEATMAVISGLQDKPTVSGPKAFLGKIQSGVRLIPTMLAFIKQRNVTLVEHGMGLGEYQYIYALAFFSQLEKDPADGPGFRLTGSDDENDQDGPVRWGVRTGDGDSGDVREDRDREVRRSLNKSLGLIAQNQLAALDQQLAERPDESLAAWREQLAAETELMDREPRRILWEEGLPSPLSDSLEPYRDRLNASYGELMNAVELGLVNHQ